MRQHALCAENHCTRPVPVLLARLSNGRQRMTVPRQLRRRRAASRRLPVLESGNADPWHYEPPTAGYEAAAAHLLGCGLLPAPNREGLRLMWSRGSHSRQAAELIAERWELTR
jgi:hypothetical protein